MDLADIWADLTPEIARKWTCGTSIVATRVSSRGFGPSSARRDEARQGTPDPPRPHLGGSTRHLTISKMWGRRWKQHRMCPRTMANDERQRTTTDFRSDRRLRLSACVHRREKRAAHNRPAEGGPGVNSRRLLPRDRRNARRKEPVRLLFYFVVLRHAHSKDRDAAKAMWRQREADIHLSNAGERPKERVEQPKRRKSTKNGGEHKFGRS